MNSRALTIARNDFSDGARSKFLWGAVLVLLVITVPDYLGMTSSDILETATQGVRFIPQVLVYFVAPVALITAHRSIVGERESGSLRVLFGHPVTRADFVVGKLLGRTALVVSILLVTMAGLAVVTLVQYGTLPLAPFIAISIWVVLYGTIWTAIIVGLSAGVSTRLQAITIGLGLFLFFGPFQLWQRLALPLFALIFTGSPSLSGIQPLKPSTWPTWYQYVLRLNPMENFVQGRFTIVSLTDPSGQPVSLGLFIVGLVILLLWAAVPLAGGYWSFYRSDLN